jgi:hypothetical protein
MNESPSQEGTRSPDVERGNEALPSMPSTEHRFEEQPQVRVERSEAPESTVREQPVVAPVQAPPATPAAPVVAVHSESQPATTEPKNQ